MAIYYVRPDGDNLNSGTGYTTSEAWQTVAKATSTVAAGDIVRIAPGTYYEVITLSTAGSVGNIITWWGDKEAQYFLDLKPGYVRITGVNSGTGLGTSASVLNCVSKAYNSFYNLVLDGNATGAYYCVVYPTTATKFYDCILSGSYAAVFGAGSASNTTLYRCVINGGYYGVYYSTCYNCISFGGGYGFDNCVTYDCIALGLYGFGTCSSYNCTACGNYFGFITPVLCINCQVIWNGYGFYGSSASTLKKCKSISCLYAFYGVSSNLDISDCKHANCYAVSVGTTIGTPTEAKYEGYTDISKLLKLANALKFDIFEQGWSSDLHEYTVAGATTPTSANNDYVTVGTYNSNNLYQSIFKDTLIFVSIKGGISPGNWVIQTNATTTPDDTALSPPNFAYSATLVGTYTNSGTFGGTITCAAYSPIVFDENYDILRQPRRMGSGSTLDCGAFEYSNTALEWTTYRTFAPSIKISQAGYKTLTIPVKMNTQKTISCWTKFDLDDGGGGADKPQMVISASGVSENILSTTNIVVTATGDGTTWEQLTSTFTPIASGLLTVNFHNRYEGDSNNSVAYFSDISL